MTHRDKQSTVESLTNIVAIARLASDPSPMMRIKMDKSSGRRVYRNPYTC